MFGSAVGGEFGDGEFCGASAGFCSVIEGGCVAAGFVSGTILFAGFGFGANVIDGVFGCAVGALAALCAIALAGAFFTVPAAGGTVPGFADPSVVSSVLGFTGTDGSRCARMSAARTRSALSSGSTFRSCFSTMTSTSSSLLKSADGLTL